MNQKRIIFKNNKNNKLFLKTLIFCNQYKKIQFLKTINLCNLCQKYLIFKNDDFLQPMQSVQKYRYIDKKKKGRFPVPV